MPTEAPTTTPPVEFLRVKDAVRVFGIGKSTLNDLAAKGIIKSHLVRSRGNVSGIRLFSADSLREYIRSHPAK